MSVGSPLLLEPPTLLPELQSQSIYAHVEEPFVDLTVNYLDSLPGTPPPPPTAVHQAYLDHIEAAGVPDPEGHFPRAA